MAGSGSRVRSALTILVALALVRPASVEAQVSTADVLGNVADSSGGAIAGATLTVTHDATGLVRTATTSAAGDYVINLLPVGRYTIQIESEGFATFVTHVTLAAGDRQRLDAALAIAGLRVSLDVTAAPNSVQADSATLAALVPERAVHELPLNGRNITGLLRLVPGASEGLPNSLSTGNRADDRRPSAAVSVNGQSDVQNNFLIDGVDNNGPTLAPAVRLALDAIAEVKIQTNLYTADVGRTGGGVVNIVTKSGSNDVHGSVYTFGRHETFDARNFFAPMTQPKPKFRQYQAGFSVGGPIRRRRTFFFADYERFHQEQGFTFVSTVPTSRMRSGDFSELSAAIYDPAGSPRIPFAGNVIPRGRIDPVGRNVLTLYPLPTSADLANNYTITRDRTQDSHSVDGRLDHQLTPSQRVWGRYSFNAADTFVPGVFEVVNGLEPGGGANGLAGPSTSGAHAAQGSYVNVVRQNLLLDVTAGYFHFTNDALPLNMGTNAAQQLGIPGINIDENTSALPAFAIAGYTVLGDGQFIPNLVDNDVLHLRATLTHTRRAHNLRVGVGVIHRTVTQYQSNQPAGLFTFTGALTDNGAGQGGNAAASVLLGFPAQVARHNLLVHPEYHSYEPSVFFQDDWRASRRLAVTLGLRWDAFTPVTEAENRIANIDTTTLRILVAGEDGVSRTANIPTDWGNIAPRLGLAATIRPDFVVRGGYGIAYSPTQFGGATLRNPPFVSAYGPVVSAGASGGLPDLLLADGLPVPTTPDTSVIVGSYSATDTGLKSSAQHQWNLITEKQLWGTTIGAGYVGARGRRIWQSVPNLNLAPPGPGPVNPRRPYFAMAPGLGSLGFLTSAGFLTYDALQATFRRRLTRGFAADSNYTWAHSMSNVTQPGGGGAPQAYGVVPSQIATLDRGASENDVRHRFVIAGGYQLPSGRSSTGLTGALLAGWQVNVIAFWQSGLPFTVVNATPRSNTGVGANGDRPDRICSGQLRDPSVSKWFDTGCFVPQALNTLGNSARNILYGPPQRRLDVSILKNSGLGSGRLEIRAECFNVTNTPSFGVPNASLGSAAFGTITTTANAPPRQFQLGVKYLF
jgi:hypothetical protein